MISGYETGKDIPRADVLAKICKALDVSADYLLELSELVESVKLSNKEWALIYDLRSGNPHALDDAMSHTMLHGGSSG
jgi:transcriptional regulator with XRE-family HTH domain